MIIFLYLYLLTISWNSAFAYGYFNLPSLFAFSFLLSSYIKPSCRLNLKVIKYVLIPFIFTSIYYILLSVINPHPKVINYTLVYIFIPLLFCYLPLTIEISKNKIKDLGIYFINSLLFIALICIFESIIRFYFKFDITSLVPQMKDNYAFTLTSLGKVLNRSRAFSSEPLIVGLSLCLGLQYSLIKIKNVFLSGNFLLIKDVLIYFFYSFIFVFAILATGSASSIVISSFGLVFLLSQIFYIFIKDLINKKLNLNILKLFIFILILLFSLLFIFQIIPAYKVSIENIISKISLDKDFTSVRVRLNLFFEYLSYFINDPLGIKGSLGIYSSKTSAINWYLTILGDVGLLGLFFTFFPLLSSIAISIYSPFNKNFQKIDKLFLIIIPLMGLLFHGTFYASPLWATILIAYYL